MFRRSEVDNNIINISKAFMSRSSFPLFHPIPCHLGWEPSNSQIERQWLWHCRSPFELYTSHVIICSSAHPLQIPIPIHSASKPRPNSVSPYVPISTSIATFLSQRVRFKRTKRYPATQRTATPITVPRAYCWIWRFKGKTASRMKMMFYDISLIEMK
jgi:hypothetical protein